MNSQIETWRVLAFKQGVYNLSQQRGSRIAPFVRKETFVGKAEFFDRLGLATAVDKTGRNEDTPDLNIEHSRRMVTTVTRHWGTLVDRKDKVQNIQDPESQYAQAAQNALGRKMDDILIEAALGTAYTGESGTSSQTLGTGQKVVPLSGTAQTKLNVEALLATKQLLDAAEAEGPRYFVLNAANLRALLGQTQVTSVDYNSVKALVNGEVDTFLGFKFIRSERIGINTASAGFTFDTTTGLYSGGGSAINASSVSCFAFVGDGLLMGMNPDQTKAKVEERADKGYSIQVYASMDFGAVRMEEAKVVEVICKP